MTQTSSMSVGTDPTTDAHCEHREGRPQTVLVTPMTGKSLWSHAIDMLGVLKCGRYWVGKEVPICENGVFYSTLDLLSACWATNCRDIEGNLDARVKLSTTTEEALAGASGLIPCPPLQGRCRDTHLCSGQRQRQRRVMIAVQSNTGPIASSRDFILGSFAS